MARTHRIAALALVFAAGSLLLAKDPPEIPPIIKDSAKLFKADTVKQAEVTGQALAKKGVRLIIETYPTIPPGMTDKVKEMTAKQREEVFEEWAHKRLMKLGPNVLHIVITDDPKHLQVTMGPEVRKLGFTPEDRQALTKAMLERLRKKEIDEALLGALGTLRRHFDAPPPKTTDKSPETALKRAR